MSAIRSRDNRTELALRRHLHSRGLRYRLHPPGVFGRPDIVFPRERVAVFVDGDFWHARRLREHGLDARSFPARLEGQEYWIAKFTRRVVRDDEVSATLRYRGWEVLRFWESDIKHKLDAAATQIEGAVRARRKGRSTSRSPRAPRS